jgi:hypothetical protein
MKLKGSNHLNCLSAEHVIWINAIWNKEELPDPLKVSIIVIV